ncbi:MAG TPA: serine/threonine-protein kinase [Kofleriaceae bacterium]|nr:serine/threonine-protein kinase [Kofleriaceae bacterium]
MSTPSPDDSGVVALGSVLDGRYRVDAILGKGGMGRVYKAEHTSLGRAVAIKVLHARLGGSKEAAQRFQREAMASGRLDHPNIVAVSDFGTLEDGSLFLVMEALEGEPLGARLERDKRIPWQEALVIVRGVLAGLRHAHDKGVVHRDIKPDNIFLAYKDGETIVKILDFGIAKLYAGNADDPASTRAGLTVGTPAYLSPEQAVGGAITPASDLYSTSIVLYEMLAGRPPFLDEEPLAMLTAHVSRDPPPFSEVAADVQIPPGLEAIIQHGLAKVSAERISTANDYLAKLDEVSRAAGYDLGMMVPRSSGSLSIPSGPHSLNPSPGFMMTPTPFAPVGTNTPARGVQMRTPSAGVPVPSSPMTPMPFASEMGTAPTQSLDGLPAAARMVSVADIAGKEPLPAKYKRIGAAMLLVAIALGVFLFVRGDKKGDGQPTRIVTVPVGTPVDNEMRLKAALHDLETGKTCADRKAAIPVLVEIGDDRAIPSLKKARYRMRGGVLGIGDSNTNACLKQDAEMAIQAIEGPMPE